MKNSKKGFTLIEMLVVIAIIAILSTVLIVGYSSFIDDANKSNAEAEAHQVEILINGALMTKKAVKISDDIWVVKASSECEFVTEDPVDGTSIKSEEVEDLTEELTGFNLALDESGIVYTSSKGLAVPVEINE